MRMTAGLVFFLPSQQHTRGEDVVAKCADNRAELAILIWDATREISG